MWYRTFIRPTLAVAAVAALTVVAAGCGGDDHDDDEPEFATMRITIGGTVVDFAGTCTPSVAQVTIPAAGAQVSASFLRADNSPDPVVTADKFELRVGPASRFTRTGAFTGTLSGGAAGAAQVTFSLFHKVEQHEDFGPCSLTVVVQ
jgi:hypothetical protein